MFFQRQIKKTLKYQRWFVVEISTTVGISTFDDCKNIITFFNAFLTTVEISTLIQRWINVENARWVGTLYAYLVHNEIKLCLMISELGSIADKVPYLNLSVMMLDHFYTDLRNRMMGCTQRNGIYQKIFLFQCNIYKLCTNKKTTLLQNLANQSVSLWLQNWHRRTKGSFPTILIPTFSVRWQPHFKPLLNVSNFTFLK